MAIIQTGMWNTVKMGLARFANALASTEKKMIRESELAARRIIVMNIESGGTLVGRPFHPNSPVTVARKGSSKPLIDNRDLIAAIAGGSFRHPSGVNLAAILHEGTNRAGRGNKVVIEPRPFIRDVAESQYLKDEIGKGLDKMYEKMLKDVF